jgi:hypothetical protein
LVVTFNEQTWRILKNLAWNKDQNNAKNWKFQKNLCN